MAKRKEVKRFDLDANFIYENIERYLDKYISINFKHYYYARHDIKHDVFIKVMKYRTFDESKAKISTYLTTVCRNTILDMDRKKKQRRKQGLVYLDDIDIRNEITDNGVSNPEEILDANDLKEHIDAIINNSLTRVERYIMEHKFLLHEKDKQILMFLNISRPTYKRYLAKLVNKLKDVFEEDDFIINYSIENNIEFDKV